MDTRINEIAKQYAQRVNERYNPKAIYLYGSYVHGATNEYSDIDIAVVIEPIGIDKYANIFSDLFSIAAKFDDNIEPNLLIDDGEYNKYSFLAEIMETGRLVDV